MRVFQLLACIYIMIVIISVNNVSEAKQNQQLNIIVQNVKNVRKSEDKVVITDIKNWKHPVKTILEQNNIENLWMLSTNF